MSTSFQALSRFTYFPSRGQRHACAGVTLIELVTVLVILGIVAAVAAPRFFTKDSFDERGFYDETVSAARYAQKLALATGCDVQFSVSASGYVLNQRATSCVSGGFTRSVVHPGTAQPSFSGTAPSGIATAMTGNPVVFNGQGYPSDSTTRTVTVGTRSFTIIGATGFVQAP